MWKWLQGKLGITQLKESLDMADKKISDLKPILDGIQTAVGTLAPSVASILAKIAQLQANAANPQNPTTLTPDDQATLNALADEATAIQTSLAGIQSSLTPPDASTGTDAGAGAGTQTGS